MSGNQSPRKRLFEAHLLLVRLVPEHTRLKEKPEVLPLGRLHHWIQSGRIDASQPITLRELHVSGCVNGIKAGGVKLLADVRVGFLRVSGSFLHSDRALLRSGRRSHTVSGNTPAAADHGQQSVQIGH